MAFVGSIRFAADNGHAAWSGCRCVTGSPNCVGQVGAALVRSRRLFGVFLLGSCHPSDHAGKVIKREAVLGAGLLRYRRAMQTDGELLKRTTAEGTRSGAVTLVFNRWKRPEVSAVGSELTAFRSPSAGRCQGSVDRRCRQRRRPGRWLRKLRRVAARASSGPGGGRVSDREMRGAPV